MATGLAEQIRLAVVQIANSMRITSGAAPANPYPGQLWWDPTGSTVVTQDSTGDANLFLPTGLFRVTIPRTNSGWAPTMAPLLSGRLSMQAIYLKAGETVSNIMFMSGSTAMATPTNWWFALYGTDGTTLLRQTADQTTAAWAASTQKTLALTTPYTVPTSGYYYLGIMVKASTVPTLYGVSINVNITGLAPVMEGTSTTALTTTAPNPALAPTRTGNVMFAGVG